MEFDRLPSGVFFNFNQQVDQANAYHVDRLPRPEYNTPEPFPPSRGAESFSNETLFRKRELPMRAYGVHSEEHHKEGDGEDDRRHLPLLEVSMGITVVGTTSRTVLTQTFSNLSNFSITESTYCFPLYDGCVLIGFRCWIGEDRLLEGKIKPKEQAKTEFREAVYRQRAAVLLEEVTPEVFETSLGNIPPQTSVKVEIQYINELKADLSGNGILVTIPTSIAPRYGASPIATSGLTVAPIEKGLKIQVEVSSSVPIRKVESRTHPISVEFGAASGPAILDSFSALKAAAASAPRTSEFDPRKAKATLSDRSSSLGKDFVLLILASDSDILASRAVLERNSSLPGLSALRVNICAGHLFSPEESMDDIKSEIVFLADRSGSMNDKIMALQSALRIFIKSIPQKCIFNIHSFGTSHSSLWGESRMYTQENVDMAVHHITNEFSANMGGTQILSALEDVVKKRTREGDMRTDIILLTDGEVWNTENIIKFVKDTRADTKEKIRFFALGIGDAVSHRLVEGIGRQGGGFAEVIAVDAAGKWETEVIRMLKGALTPSQWKIKIILPEVRDTSPYSASLDAVLSTKLPIQRPIAIQAPYYTPSLHAFARTSVYFFLDPKLLAGQSTIRIQGVASSGEKFESDIPLEEVESQHPTIHFLAAKALMNDLESGQSWMHANEHLEYKSRNPAAFEKIVQQEAEEIGMKWSIAGEWTSFVAVDGSNHSEQKTRIYLAERSELADLTRSRTPRSSTYNYPITTAAGCAVDRSIIRLQVSERPRPPQDLKSDDEKDLNADSKHHKGTKYKALARISEIRSFEHRGREYPEYPIMNCETSYSPPKNNIVTMTLAEIINLQTIWGFFNISDKLVSTLPGSAIRVETIEKIKSRLQVLYNLDTHLSKPATRIFDTLIIVFILEERFYDDRDMWSLVAQKAWAGVDRVLRGKESRQSFESTLREKIDI
jgi:hypothetical protein